MKKTNMLRLILIVALAAFFFAGCAKKPVAEPIPAPKPVAVEVAPVVVETLSPEIAGIEEQEVTEAAIIEEVGEIVAEVPALTRIFFEFDRYTLTEEARAILAGNAAHMKAVDGVKVRIEGHCDERGSDEYNLALGERRALSAMNYIVSLGISPERVSIISYGEEMPLDPAKDDAAWTKNRRVEFKAVR